MPQVLPPHHRGLLFAKIPALNDRVVGGELHVRMDMDRPAERMPVARLAVECDPTLAFDLRVAKRIARREVKLIARHDIRPEVVLITVEIRPDVLMALFGAGIP